MTDQQRQAFTALMADAAKRAGPLHLAAMDAMKRVLSEPHECPRCGNLYDHRYPCAG